MIVNTYRILHTLIPLLTDCALGCLLIFTFIWRLDATVGWHITTRSRVERQGKSLIPKIFWVFHLIIWQILFPDLLQYLIPWARVGEATSAADDSKISAELWIWLEEQVKDIWSMYFFILFLFLHFEGYISNIANHTNLKSFPVRSYTAISLSL